jgi:hypothetical protein
MVTRMSGQTLPGLGGSVGGLWRLVGLGAHGRAILVTVQKDCPI